MLHGWDTRGFNPRPRAGGDVNCSAIRNHPPAFQSTPPCGGRPTSARPDGEAPRFQSTPPCGGRPPGARPPRKGPRFQSTPPCGGRRRCRRGLGGGTGVSIHAPVRGATCHLQAPPIPCARFNPRPRAGGDGAAADARAQRGGFNPRPRAGGDTKAKPTSFKQLLFQSTPPCGGRPAWQREMMDWIQVSIHAPVRGATMSTERSDSVPLFQSTPPCGGRPGPGLLVRGAP